MIEVRISALILAPTDEAADTVLRAIQAGAPAATYVTVIEHSRLEQVSYPTLNEQEYHE